MNIYQLIVLSNQNSSTNNDKYLFYLKNRPSYLLFNQLIVKLY